MKYFITGTGTDVGKTYVTSLLMKQNGWRAVKPVSCGGTDEEVLGCKALYSLKTPVSPHHAARIENVKLDFGHMVDFCRNSGAELIEGAGGVMSPLTDEHTNLDLMRELGIPVIIVAGNYVGTLTHTLTALKMLEVFDVKIILNEYAKSMNNSKDIAADIKNFSGYMPLILKYGQQDCDIK
jgi:dethiobiotin synthetase